MEDLARKFECKCVLQDLRCFSVGYGKSKKLAKFEAAKKTIQVISCIPDVEQVLFSLIMASNLSDNVMLVSQQPLKHSDLSNMNSPASQ